MTEFLAAPRHLCRLQVGLTPQAAPLRCIGGRLEAHGAGAEAVRLSSCWSQAQVLALVLQVVTIQLLAAWSASLAQL